MSRGRGGRSTDLLNGYTMLKFLGLWADLAKAHDAAVNGENPISKEYEDYWRPKGYNPTPEQEATIAALVAQVRPILDGFHNAMKDVMAGIEEWNAGEPERDAKLAAVAAAEKNVAAAEQRLAQVDTSVRSMEEHLERLKDVIEPLQLEYDRLVVGIAQARETIAKL